MLGRTFPIWFKNFVPFTLLSAVVYLPLVAYVIVAGGGTESGAQAFAFTTGANALPLILTGAIVYGVFEQVRGQRIGILKCLRVGLGRLLPVLGLAIIVGALVTAGTYALVIPGILLQLVLWVAVPVAVVERLGVVASIKRSMQLTSGERGTIFLINLVLGVIQIVMVSVLVLLLVANKGGSSVNANLGLITVLVCVPLGALWAVANAVGYHDLRVAKEGVGIEELVSVFA